MIRLGPETKTLEQKGTLIDRVCHTVWQDLKLEERKAKIVDLSDYELGRKVHDLARGFEYETQWMLETIVDRLDINLDEEDPDDD